VVDEVLSSQCSDLTLWTLHFFRLSTEH
jgi:hypothetical protein